ncbi:MAG: hypothetical protein ACTSV7_01880, partial [Candidatus Baldrarchaeia archaeon]
MKAKEYLKEASISLSNGLPVCSIILTAKAIEISLRDIFDIPELHRAGLIDLLYFAKDNNVHVPDWDFIQRLRTIRNMCLHGDYVPSIEQARNFLDNAKLLVEKIGEIEVSSSLKRKAYEKFRVDPKYKYKKLRLSDIYLFLGTMFFMVGLNLILLIFLLSHE